VLKIAGLEHEDPQNIIPAGFKLPERKKATRSGRFEKGTFYLFVQTSFMSACHRAHPAIISVRYYDLL
jgi:hypothetical protein